MPYRDFQLEYPPGALPVFVIPSWLESFNYQDIFQLLMAICLVVVVLSVLRIGGWEAAVLAGVAPLALGSVVLSRFDLWPAALTAAALATLLAERFGASAVLLGTAFAAKLWPAVLVPFVVVWLVRTTGRDSRRGGVRSPSPPRRRGSSRSPSFRPPASVTQFHEQFARPVQIESLASAVLIAIHESPERRSTWSTRSARRTSQAAGTHAAAIVTTVLGVIALVAIWVLFLRSDATTADLLAYCAAAVAALMAFGKVFSPQFMIWLIPLVMVVRGVRGQLAIPVFFLTWC